MFLCVIVSGQTVLVEDSFENYAPDDRIADVSAVGWDTWSGSTGTAEDGLVTSEEAYSGTNAMLISGTNDVILRLANEPLTEGRYVVSWKMNVKTGSAGYYNLLHYFTTSRGPIVRGLRKRSSPLKEIVL